jgi:hypothetical protein
MVVSKVVDVKVGRFAPTKTCVVISPLWFPLGLSMWIKSTIRICAFCWRLQFSYPTIEELVIMHLMKVPCTINHACSR